LFFFFFSFFFEGREARLLLFSEWWRKMRGGGSKEREREEKKRNDNFSFSIFSSRSFLLFCFFFCLFRLERAAHRKTLVPFTKHLKKEKKNIVLPQLPLQTKHETKNEKKMVAKERSRGLGFVSSLSRARVLLLLVFGIVSLFHSLSLSYLSFSFISSRASD